SPALSPGRCLRRTSAIPTAMSCRSLAQSNSGLGTACAFHGQGDRELRPCPRRIESKTAAVPLNDSAACGQAESHSHARPIDVKSQIEDALGEFPWDSWPRVADRDLHVGA